MLDAVTAGWSAHLFSNDDFELRGMLDSMRIWSADDDSSAALTATDMNT